MNTDGLSQESRAKLVAPLYAQLRSFVEGALAQAICVLTCWYWTRWPGFAVLLCAVLAACAWRLRQRARFLSRHLRPSDAARPPEYWTRQFVYGISVTGFLWSEVTTLAYLRSHDVPLEMLVLLVQASWLGGGCVRNAASPLTVFAQSVTALCPVLIGLAFSKSGFMHFVELFAVLQLSANFSVSRHIGSQLSSLLASEERLEAANSRLEMLSATDGLTGIGNRRAFDMKVQAEWSRALREQTPLAVLMVDVDFFKAYNDRYGHPAGDHCLQTLARILERGLRRPPDFVGRFGGEEFVCLLPGTDEAGAVEVAGRMLAAIAEAGLVHEMSPSGLLSASIGAASLIPQQGEQIAELIERADQALYRAKALGRNRVCIPERAAQPSLGRQVLSALSWVPAARRAVNPA